MDRVSFLGDVEERGVERLFTLSLAEFVPARNALAKAVKATGDKETAARIQKLPKPSISAWAINQLVRKEPELIRALLGSLDRQRDLQLAGLGAGVDRSALKEAKQTENQLIGEIERALPAILESDGHSAGRNAIERCVRAIRAAAVHPVGRPLLENGHLTVDFDSLGFEALGADVEIAPPKLRLISGEEELKKEERRRELERQRIEAQERLEEERRRLAERREQERAREAEQSRKAAERAEHTKRLASLRLERARLEEQVAQLSVQIAQLEQSLAGADEAEEER